MLKKITILIILLFIALSFPTSAAQSKEELQQIKKQLDIHKKKLREAEKVERNVLEDLKKVSKELEDIETQIKIHNLKIRNLQIKIAQTEKEIKNFSNQLETRKSYLIIRMKGIQRLNKQPDPVLIILMQDDTTKALRLIRNTQKIMSVDKKLIQQYKTELENLIVQQAELKKLYTSLRQEKESLKRAEETQKQKKKEREILLAQVRQNKALYERKIKELEENARRLTRLLQKTEKKEKIIGTPITSLPEGEFTKRKGNLIWPVSGSVITHYGSQKDPLFNIPIFRSGIYIQSSPGTQVKAAAEGKVVYANYFKGYENLVIISHGDGYYTVYGNLGSLGVKEGVYVKAGQILGSVGEKSSIDKTAVYFEIRYRGKPLNPEEWLRK